MYYTEMPTFRNQMRVRCELSFAECANQLGSLGVFKPPKWSRSRVKAPVPFCCLGPSILLEDLIWGTN